MSEPAIKKELRPLTSFRFLAALYVFLFHIQIRIPLVEAGPLKNFIAEGAVGMTMFFMLSGFILMHVYQNIFNMKNYLLNRFARVYPIYFLAAILALPWLLSDIYDSSKSTDFSHLTFQVIIIITFGLVLLQAWLPQLFFYWNNSASWSISNEAFFYGVFPLFRTWLPRLSLGWLVFLICASIFISILIPISMYAFQNTPNPSFSLTYTNPAYRIPEFFSGCLFYLVAKRIRSSSTFWTFLLVTTIGFVIYLAAFGDMMPTFTLHNFISIPAIGACLIFLFNMPERSDGIWSCQTSVWLGRISYCFYSFQFHVLEGLRYFVDPDQIGGAIFGVMSFAVLIVVSAIAHHFVEEPCRKWIRSRSRPLEATVEASITRKSLS